MDPAHSGVDPIDEIVGAHWALAAAGLSDFIWGHASLRAPDGEGIYLKASGWSFEEIDRDKIVKVGWDGTLLDGVGGVHIEVPIHTQVMSARPDVGAVVHCHAPAVTAFASLNQPLRAISHEGVFFAPNLPRFELTGDLIRSRELGNAVATVLGSAPALIIPQHGLVAAGPDIATAVMYAVLLEQACRVQLLAASAGGPKVWSSDEEIKHKAEVSFRPGVYTDRTYQYLLRVGSRLHVPT